MSTIVTQKEASHGFHTHGQNIVAIATFGGIEYYLDQTSAEIITFQPSRPSSGLFSGLNGDLFPCTVINWSKDHFNKEDLDAISAKFALHDDVWTQAFLQSETSWREIPTQ